MSSPSISPDLIRPRIIHSDLHAKGLAGMLDVETSPRMQRILSRAAEIGKLHTGKPFVGTENVLRALIEDDDGIAVTVLRELGVAERVAERLDEIMGSSSYRGP